MPRALREDTAASPAGRRLVAAPRVRSAEQQVERGECYAYQAAYYCAVQADEL